MKQEDEKTQKASWPWLSLGFLVLFVVVLWFYGHTQKNGTDVSGTRAGQPEEVILIDSGPTPQSSTEIPRGGDGKQLLETDIFVNYGFAGYDMKRDLVILQEGIMSYLILAKQDDLPTGSNAMCMAALRGNNRAGIRFLRDDHPMLNAEGELVDRWGTPVYFHAISARNIGLRSAGPDQAMWTDDDVTLGEAAEPLAAKEEEL